MTQISPVRRIAGFLILFLLYQSAEGVGGLLMHNAAISATLMVAALLAAWPVGRWVLGYRGYDAYGLDRSVSAFGLVTAGLLLMGAVRLAAVFWGLADGTYALGPAPAAGSAVPGAIAYAMLSTLVASLAEDIITRGFWLKASGLRWTAPTFILGTSLIYLLNHIYRLGDGPLEWLRLFCFGIAYAAACWRWRSLWAALGLHWGWNLANALLDVFISVNASGPTAWLSAGSHLVVAAIVLLLPKPPARAISA
jgi:membrane protease YdiL (CAAX protease family)